jgi:hypothetical protein
MIGVLLLYLAADNPTESWLGRHRGVEALTRELGALLFTGAALSLLWELVAKRAFVRELRAEIGLPRDLEDAGIIGVEVKDFFRGLDWEKTLNESSHLDALVSYASTWRKTNREALNALGQRKGASVRIFLPDPTKPVVTAELASRFDTTPEQIATTIEDAARDFEGIFSGKKAKFELWYIAAAPVFSFYRFERHAYISLYKHRRGRDYIPPTIVISKTGTIWTFLQQEIDALTSGPTPLGRKVI